MKQIFFLVLYCTLSSSMAFSSCDSVRIEMQRIDFTTGAPEYRRNVQIFNQRGQLTSLTEYVKGYSAYQFVNSKKTSYFYDANDSLVQKIIQTGNDTSWFNSQQRIYTYNNSGYPLTILVQNWDANTWQTVLTDSFLYDLQNNLLSHSTYYTNQAQRILFDYNVLNQDTLEILQNFDFTLGQWQNANRTENEYNLSGLLKQSTIYDWNLSAWDSTSRIIYSYINSYPDSIITLAYDTAWVNESMTLYDYSPFNQVIHKYTLGWADTAWVYVSNVVTEVDQFGFPSYHDELYANYDSNGNITWTTVYGVGATYYTCDTLGNILSWINYDHPATPATGNYSYDGNILMSYIIQSTTMGGFTRTTGGHFYFAELIGNSVLCSGQSTVLSLDSCTGYSFLWSTGETTASILVSSPGVYSATITHPDGFIAHTEAIEITFLNGPPVLPLGADSIFSNCSTQSLELSVPVSPFAHYQWYRNDSILSQKTEATFRVYYTSVIEGIYYLVAWNACGIDTSANTDLRVTLSPDTPVITASGPLTICEGDSVTLTSSPAYAYNWSPTGQSTSSITVGTTNYYTVTVYDAIGCSSKATVRVNKIAYPSPPQIIFSNGYICALQSSYHYQWLLNGDTIPGATSGCILPIIAGDYSLEIANGYPCISYSDTLFVDPGALGVNAGPDRVACMNGSLVFSRATPVIGGTPPYSYHWGPGINLTDFGDGRARFDSITGDFVCYLNVTDATGLTVTDSIHCTLDLPLVPDLIVTGIPNQCANSYNTLTLDYHGDSYSVLNWIANGNSIASTSNVFQYAESGIFQIHIADSNNCSVYSLPDTVNIETVFSLPQPVLHVEDTLPCYSGNARIWVNSEAGATYSWVKDYNTSIGNDTLEFINSPGYYMLTVVDSNGCSGSSLVNFDIDDQNIYFNIQTSNSTICGTDSITLSAAIFPGWVYYWYLNSNMLQQHTPDIRINQAGEYHCSIISPTGCVGDSYKTINGGTFPIVNINLSAGLLSADLSGNTSYQWFLNGQEIPFAYNRNFLPIHSGTYYVRVWNSQFSCFGYSNSIYVGLCSVNILPLVNSVCSGQCIGELVANGVGAGVLNYSWSTTNTTPGISGLCPGEYVVSMIDSEGCVVSDTAEILLDSIVVELQVMNPSCGGCTDGSIQFNIQGGNPPYQYSIQPSLGSFLGNSIQNLPAGNYTFCVIDQNGCISCDNDSLSDIVSGITELDRGSLFLSPNPVANYLEIHGMSHASFGFSKLQIFDVRGRLVKSFSENKRLLNVHDLDPGIYVLKFFDADNIWYLRFVKN